MLQRLTRTALNDKNGVLLLAGIEFAKAYDSSVLVFKNNVNVQRGFEMSKLLIGFLGVIVLSGLIDAKADAALINETSSIFVGDLGYYYENLDFTFIDIYDSGDGSKIADVSGGFIGTLGAIESSRINLYAGSVGYFNTFHSSTGNIYGGSVVSLESYDSSSVSIFGGFFENFVRTCGYSQMVISGGIFATELLAIENSIMTICGTDFSIDGFSVGYGEIAVTSGILAGTLASGETINNNFKIYEDATIVLVPEPATVLLLGLGSLFLIRRL